MLNPVFSIAHMRNMVPIFHEVGHKVVLALVLTMYVADLGWPSWSRLSRRELLSTQSPWRWTCWPGWVAQR